jgi:hypothetical protein
MRLFITVFIIFIFHFFSCIENSAKLYFYKIEDIYIGVYKLNKEGLDLHLLDTNKFYHGDSILVGLSFSISYCDSAKQQFKKTWEPSRGYRGVVDRIKEISISVKGEKKYYSLLLSDFYLVEDSLNYEVKKGKDIKGRTNSLSRKGCRLSLNQFISKINSNDECYRNNSLNSTYLIYYLNTKKLFDGENNLRFQFEFENFSITKEIVIKIEQK